MRERVTALLFAILEVYIFQPSEYYTRFFFGLDVYIYESVLSIIMMIIITRIIIII